MPDLAAEIHGRPGKRDIERAAELSPLRRGEMSELVDPDELHFREVTEPIGEPPDAIVAFIERKELIRRIEEAVARTGVVPAGRVVELGAGSCWLAAWLASRPGVERVVAIDISERRLTQLAPAAIAYFAAPAGKVERVVGDFHVAQVPPQSVELVVTDAAFHHSGHPDVLARTAFEMLRPGGTFLLHREATVTLIRRWRDYGSAEGHGDFEHDYQPREYLRILRDAGFDARKVRVSSGFRSRWRRAQSRPPLSWANPIAWGWYAFVGEKPG